MVPIDQFDCPEPQIENDRPDSHDMGRMILEKEEMKEIREFQDRARNRKFVAKIQACMIAAGSLVEMYACVDRLKD